MRAGLHNKKAGPKAGFRISLWRSSGLYSRMIWSENRFPLFGIMLYTSNCRPSCAATRSVFLQRMQRLAKRLDLVLASSLDQQPDDFVARGHQPSNLWISDVRMFWA